MAAKKKAQEAAPSVGDKTMAGRVERLAGAHRQNLVNLKAERGQLAERLEQVEDSIKMTEGAIIALNSLMEMEDEPAEPTDPTTVPSAPVSEPEETVELTAPAE